MPIFNNEFTFIHIPKCGGTSIENFLTNNGYQIKLFKKRGEKSIYINGHTPQHCTFKELEQLGLLTDKIFTIIRPEIDRVISEYFYLKKMAPNKSKMFNNFDEFLDIFLDKKNCLLFDYHNVSNKEFLTNKLNYVDERIKIFDFFDTESIENYLGIKGLSQFHEMKPNQDRYNFMLTEEQKIRINNFFK